MFSRVIIDASPAPFSRNDIRAPALRSRQHPQGLSIRGRRLSGLKPSELDFRKKLFVGHGANQPLIQYTYIWSTAFKKHGLSIKQASK
jgi:hypothetical protein